MSYTSFVIVGIEPLGEADPFCRLSLFQHTVCPSLYLPRVMCSPHLQTHLFLHPIIAYKEMGKKKKQNSLQEADMPRYHGIYQYLQQKGHFSLTKAGERYTGKERGEDNRTESELKQTEPKALCWREWRSEQSEGKRGWCEKDSKLTEIRPEWQNHVALALSQSIKFVSLAAGSRDGSRLEESRALQYKSLRPEDSVSWILYDFLLNSVELLLIFQYEKRWKYKPSLMGLRVRCTLEERRRRIKGKEWEGAGW